MASPRKRLRSTVVPTAAPPSPPRPPSTVSTSPSSSPPRPSSPRPLSPWREAPPPQRPLTPPPSPVVGNVGFYGYIEVAKKRASAVGKRRAGILYSFELKAHADVILNTHGVWQLQALIKGFVHSPIKKRRKIKRILDSLELNYPNSYSLKLVGLLCGHVPGRIRNAAVFLLHQTLVVTHRGDLQAISDTVLLELKKSLLEYFKIESDEELISLLSPTIGSLASRIYFNLGGWEELLEYITECLLDEGPGSALNLKGMSLLSDLPLSCVNVDDLWLDANYSVLCSGFFSLTDSPDSERFKPFAFEAGMILAGMAAPLGMYDIGDSLFSLMMWLIDGEEDQDYVQGRLQALADTVCLEQIETFKDKEGELFRSMLRIMEREGADEEVRVEAVRVLRNLHLQSTGGMVSVARKMSPAEVRGVLAVAMDMLLSVNDDPCWHSVSKRDSDEAGISAGFRMGRFLLNWLCFDGKGSVVARTVLEMVREEYYHFACRDWRKRHAGMLAIANILEGQKKNMIKYYCQVESLLVTAVTDEHPRVLWAAIDAVGCLSKYKELASSEKYYTFLAKLVSIIKCRPSPRVKAQAVRAIRYSVKNCGFDKTTSFGMEIVTEMLVLLQINMQKLREEALETLKSIAVLIPATLSKYYDATMETLKAIVKDYVSPNFLLRAKSLECMSYIILRHEQYQYHKQDTVQQDAAEVMDSIVSLEEKLLAEIHTSVRVRLLKALDQLCRCRQVNKDIVVAKVMKMLLRSAQVDFDLKDNRPGDDDPRWVETERLVALRVLSLLSIQPNFSLSMSEVVKIFAGWLGCSSFETQKVSILALPRLLFSIKSVVKDEQSQISFSTFIVQSLVEALHKETYGDQFIRMLTSLPKCIKISGSFLAPELIKMIADEINHMLNMFSRKMIDMERAHKEGTSKVGSKYLQDKEIIQIANELVRTTMETFRAQFSPYIDDLMLNVAALWGDFFPDRVKAMAISIFNIIVRQLPDKLQMYHDQYTSVLLKGFMDEIPHAQMEAMRGIGLCAVFGGDRFKSIANAAISILDHEIKKRSSSSGGSDAGGKLYDMAVSALGKICNFHRGSIDGPQVISNWLSFLPLKNDYKEAKFAHAQLCKMLRRSDVDLLGPNNENLPKIIAVLREILSRSFDLANEDSFQVIVNFLGQHGAMS